jgi:carboxyl-terminal processing protease
MKRYTLSLIVLVIAIGVPFLLISPNERSAMSGDGHVTQEMFNDALTDAIRIAKRNYYKPIEDSSEMFRGSIKGALASLNDPYTYYVSPREHQRAVENLYNAQFGGLGIHIYEDHRGFIKISKPIPNTPAALANLQAGDYITKVNGKRIHLSEKTGLHRDNVVDLLRGEIGTDVTITVQRKFLDPFDVTLTRGKIPVNSVRSTMLEGDIGYIRITGFIGSRREDGTEGEFTEALEAHKASGMKALILDLRDNQGGLLNAAYHIADAFIDEGLIVSTKGERREFNEEYPATSELLCPSNIPLIVLVNEYSASASEIVAGAIRDTRRGILVGQKTYGKGVVQKRYPLPDGGSMSLTISTYYTPNGASINDVGISPQVAIEPDEPDEIEQLMLRKVDVNGDLRNFVTKWIDDHYQRPGEMPKDFSLLETELPNLQETLEEERIFVSLRWLKQRAEELFNLHVGIESIVNLDYDRQLQEAIRIIKAEEIEKYLDPIPEEAEMPSTTQADVLVEREPTEE